MCVCVIVCNQQVSVEWGRNARASHCSALPRVDFPATALAEASAGSGEPKKIRLRLFSLGASNRIQIPRLLSLSILVSNTINCKVKTEISASNAKFSQGVSERDQLCHGRLASRDKGDNTLELKALQLLK